MKTNLALVAVALALTASWAHAQTPVFVTLPSGALPTDVSVSAANGLVVVGTQPGGAFRWTPAGGAVVIGLNTPNGSTVRISDDGSTVVADEALTPTVCSRWQGSTWTPIPGIGGVSAGGGEETQTGDVNADGTVIAGTGNSVTNITHGLRWNLGIGSTDLGPFFNSPTSRAFGVNGDGTVIVGWQQQSMAVGVRWVNGVMSTFNYVDPSNVSHFVQFANMVNSSGTIVVGKGVYGVAGGNGWRWDSGTNAITLLPNIAGGGNAIPLDLTNDGSLIVGNDGSPTLGAARRAVIWVQGVPMDPLSYFGGLGMASTGFTELGNITAITRNGVALVGAGITGGAGQPGGWVIYYPDLISTGTPFCSGDGSGTACPCGNSGGTGLGCASSSFATGAILTAIGTASVTDGVDTIVLSATNVPGPGLFFQGTAQLGGGTGTPFGDGLLCITGTLVRMGVVFPTGNSASYPGGLTPQPIHTAGGPLSAGDVRHYQCWYRDAAAFCSPSTFNLTQGLTLTWGL